MDHIYGEYTLPCTSLWGDGFRGIAHFYPPYLEIEFLKFVLTEKNMLCRLAKVHRIGYFVTFTL